MARACMVGAAAIAALGGGARAQHVVDLQRADPGVSDVGPLGESLRLLPIDLRVSDGFEKVYRVTDEHGQARYVRRDGALTAVFPRSEYIPTAYGPLAAIPAGTRFIIGEAGAEALTGGSTETTGARQSMLGASQRIDRRADRPQGLGAGGRWGDGSGASAGRGGDDPARETGRTPYTPWRSEQARGRRITGLLTLASGSGSE